MMPNVWAHCVHFHLYVAFYVFKAYRGKRNEDWVCEDISFYDSMKKFISLQCLIASSQSMCVLTMS